jgi:hypothetical protein
VRLTNEVIYSGSTYVCPTSEFTLGTTVNVDTKTAEFDSEYLSGQAIQNIIPDSGEFDTEASEVIIRNVQSDPQSQYGFEADSPFLSIGYLLAVDPSEYDFEDSSTQNVVIESLEYDIEIQSVGIPIDAYIGANDSPAEFGHELDSPGLFSRGLLRGYTPHRRRIIAGRASTCRRLDPQYRPECTASRRTEVFRPRR